MAEAPVEETEVLSDDSDIFPNINAIQPYDYQPRYTQEELEQIDRNIEQEAGRLGNTNWCQCQQCVQMETANESICCAEFEAILGKLAEVEGNQHCITLHRNFYTVILDPTILEVAFLRWLIDFGGGRGQAPDHLNNEQSRFTAYRQFIAWAYRGQRLGRHNRVPLPSCIVKKIKEEYPSPDGNYRGFLEHYELQPVDEDNTSEGSDEESTD